MIQNIILNIGLTNFKTIVFLNENFSKIGVRIDISINIFF
jgi:hypothetical protein